MFRRKKKDQQQAPPEVVSPLPKAQWRSFVEAVWGVLGRNADADGARHALERLEAGISASELIYEIMGSEEFESLQQGSDTPAGSLPNLHVSTGFQQLSDKLEACDSLGRAAFDRAWNELPNFPAYQVIGQQDYCELHRERFYELANAAAWLTRDKRAPRILEIGASAFSNCYHLLFPAAQLELLDRPTADDYPGFSGERCRQIAGCQTYHCVDLNDVGAMSAEFVGDSGYDLVLFAETLSQLTVNPVELFEKLLGLLATDGYLYISTPNFFSARYRKMMGEGRNPSPYYPRGDGNWDGHHLYRDFSLAELLECVSAAGEVSAAYFSACRDRDAGELPLNQRKSIVCVAQNTTDPAGQLAAEERELILHIGSDKAGSTAIQAHTYANRDWLVRSGIYVPASFLGKNNGHAALLESLDAQKLETLVEELEQKAGTFRKIFLSWEGTHFLDDSDLKLLAKYLSCYQVRIIYYLREQADVIQSGALQIVKSQKQAIDLYDEARTPRLPDTRDYYRTLKRWESYFPGLVSEVVFYDRAAFPDGNVIKDLLVRLGCEDFSWFSFFSEDINVSLDVPSALAIQRRLDLGARRNDRRDFVDSLLLNLRLTGAGQKYYLLKDQVDDIRAHYKVCNEQLISEYGVDPALLGARDDIWVQGDGNFSGNTESLVEGILAQVDQLADHPVCFGGFTRGDELEKFLDAGWEPVPEGGAWSDSTCSSLKLRPYLQSVLPFHKHVNLHIRGHYAEDGEGEIEVFINGVSYGQITDGDAVYSVALQDLPATLGVDVELRPAAGAGASRKYLLEALRLVASD